MRFPAMICLAAVSGLSAGAAARAAGGGPTAVVQAAERAQLAGKPVAAGTAVHAGESLTTATGGTLELRAGSTELSLGSSTRATLIEADPSADSVQTIHAVVAQGTLKFSAPASAAIAIETPAGVLSGDSGYAASGMVAITEADTLTTSAFGENLILDNDGELHLLKAGHSYRVAISDVDADAQSQGTDAEGPPISAYSPHKRRKLGLWLIGGGVTALASVEDCDVARRGMAQGL
jgi:hypothetical protein